MNERELLTKPQVEDIDEGDLYFDDKFNILFIKRSWGLEPFMIDAIERNLDNEVTYEGLEIPIDRNNAYYLLLRFVAACSDRFDKMTGDRQVGFMETWQWGSCLKIVKGAVKLNNDEFLVGIARQAELKRFA